MLIACKDSESVLEMLYELWIDNDPVCDEEVRALYRQVRELTAQAGPEDRDCLSNIVADLCVAYSRSAFIDGGKMAGTLMLEILAGKHFFD